MLPFQDSHTAHDLRLEITRFLNHALPVRYYGCTLMKHCLLRPLFALAFCTQALAQEVPALFKEIFKPNEPTKAELVVVVPPPEIEKYISKVAESTKKDPAWFAEHAKTSKPGVPLPFHEKLGLTQAEYDEYIALWNKREFKVAHEIGMMLRLTSDGRWNLLGAGPASAISSLRFSEKEDNWKSSNGILKRLADIDADPMSILGGWKGKEWKFEEETTLSKLKENVAVGATNDGKYHLIVYRAQENTSAGTRLLDKSLVIRIPKAIAANKAKSK